MNHRALPPSVPTKPNSLERNPAEKGAAPATPRPVPRTRSAPGTHLNLGWLLAFVSAVAAPSCAGAEPEEIGCQSPAVYGARFHLSKCILARRLRSPRMALAERCRPFEAGELSPGRVAVILTSLGRGNSHHINPLRCRSIVLQGSLKNHPNRSRGAGMGRPSHHGWPASIWCCTGPHPGRSSAGSGLGRWEPRRRSTPLDAPTRRPARCPRSPGHPAEVSARRARWR